MNTATQPNSYPIDAQTPLVKVGLTLLVIPLMRMELLPHVLPKWFSDFSFGLMFRLGILFGLLLLAWQVASPRELLKVRNMAFLLASVASAWAAIWLGRFAPDNFGMLEITVTGAICLAASHKFILGCTWTQAVAAIICAPGLFHLISFVFAQAFPPGSPIRESFGNYMPYYWQMGYLLGMFGVGDFAKKGAINR